MRSDHRLRTGLTQGPDVVDDVSPCIQHGLHDLWFVGVDRNRNPKSHGFTHQRQHAREFIFERHNGCARTGGLAANVQNMRAILDELFTVTQCGMQAVVTAPI